MADASELIELPAQVPFVEAVLAFLDGRSGPGRAAQALRRAEASHELRILADEGTEPGDGVFLPRDAGLLPEWRVREVARSWESFDRAFEREEEARTDERLRRQLWPFLDDTCLLLGGVDFAPDHLMAFDDGAVGSWSAASWGRVLAEWARARRFGGRDDWHQDAFARSLEGVIRDYPRWRDAVRTVISSQRSAISDQVPGDG